MDYDRFGELVLQQIDSKGREVDLLALEKGMKEQVEDVQVAVRSRTVKALFVDYRAEEIDGRIIRHGDRHCLIAGKVDIHELLIDEGKQYNIVTVREVKPNHEVVYSRVQLRLDK
ncbi:MAG: hypothetical protein INR69_07080 [Mucilaginibacter polytrichastri]|nr:hypothetical protein [Mucilaginibacter polytrichastri]